MSSRSVSPSQRLGVLIAFAVQLAGPAAVPLAEAQAQGKRTESHVESERAKPCPPGHNDRYCQLCRAITLPAALGTGSPRCLVLQPVVRHVSAAATSCSRSRPELAPLLARAPPA